jgi:hypothetical protein
LAFGAEIATGSVKQAFSYSLEALGRIRTGLVYGATSADLKRQQFSLDDLLFSSTN